MSKTITLIYQDCPFCNMNEQQKKDFEAKVAEMGLSIFKMSFVQPKAKDLIIKASKAGIKTMPFFTDGEIFSHSIGDFLVKEEPVAVEKPKKKSKRKTVKAKVEEIKDGDSSEI